MYRLRTLLDTLSPNAGHTMILSRGGGYTWNPEYPIDLDTELFEALLDSLTNLTKALALYDGPFLRLQSSESWVLPLSAYYQNLYIDALQQAVTLYEQDGRYEEALQACRKALAIDPYYEGGYQMSMRCLLEMGQRRPVTGTVTFSFFYIDYQVKCNNFFKIFSGVSRNEPSLGLGNDFTITNQSWGTAQAAIKG